MSAFEGEWWESRYAGHHGPAAHGPSPYLQATAAGLTPGRALDAGCGEGEDAIWLAEHGWKVTAVDISASALARAGAQADEAGVRVEWEVADLTTWEPSGGFDLVTSHYVHTRETAGDLVARLAAVVVPGGTLLVVGHAPSDAHSSAHAPEGEHAHASTTADELAAALDPGLWDVITAGLRRRIVQVRGREVELDDAVLLARRR